MNNIILFDGNCNFCDRSVQFIMKRDPTANYKFASLQSEIGEKIIKSYSVPKKINSLLLVENNAWYSKSGAVLRICKNLTGIWKVFYYLLIIPRPIRDVIYTSIANNRYKWFGRKDRCEIPSPEIRKRFL